MVNGVLDLGSTMYFVGRDNIVHRKKNVGNKKQLGRERRQNENSVFFLLGHGQYPEQRQHNQRPATKGKCTHGKDRRPPAAKKTSQTKAVGEPGPGTPERDRAEREREVAPTLATSTPTPTPTPTPTLSFEPSGGKSHVPDSMVVVPMQIYVFFEPSGGKSHIHRVVFCRCVRSHRRSTPIADGVLSPCARVDDPVSYGHR